MHRHIKPILFALCLCTLCACANDQPLFDTRTVIIEPPAELYECPDVPPMPDGDYTQKNIAVLTTKLYESGAACKQALTAVKSFVESQKAIVGNSKSEK